MMTRHTLKSTTKRKYHHDSTMSKVEIMLTTILFHESGYRPLKNFIWKSSANIFVFSSPRLFPTTALWNRKKEVTIPQTLFIKKVLLGKCTGISFVDSTPLQDAKTRESIFTRRSWDSTKRQMFHGWSLGFKLHLICNEREELLNFTLTTGDMDNRKPLEYKPFWNSSMESLLATTCIGKSLFKNCSLTAYSLQPSRNAI